MRDTPPDARLLTPGVGATVLVRHGAVRRRGQVTELRWTEECGAELCVRFDAGAGGNAGAASDTAWVSAGDETLTVEADARGDGAQRLLMPAPPRLPRGVWPCFHDSHSDAGPVLRWPVHATVAARASRRAGAGAGAGAGELGRRQRLRRS